MSLNVIKAGICDTFQDEGRKGFQHLGVNPGGAMDSASMRIANMLVSNPAGTAVLEMHFPAAALLFREPCFVALAGADFDPIVNGEEIPMLHPVWIDAGSELHFRERRKGSWCYLAIHGGFTLECWLDSYATHLKAGKGGWKGRRLQKDDVIPARTPLRYTGVSPKVMPWSAVPVPHSVMEEEIAIIEGPEWTMLGEESRQSLLHASFTITPSSDRMGYSLTGPALARDSNQQMVSSAVVSGALQLLPDGQLIVLMADHQTTGGYPCIGYVISAHLSKLAQHKPGDRIRFGTVEQVKAQQLWLEQYLHLKKLEYACHYKTSELNL